MHTGRMMGHPKRTGKNNMRASPSRVLSDLLAHKVAQVSAEASHERRSRSDAVRIKSIGVDDVPLPQSFSLCLPQQKSITMCCDGMFE